MRRPNSFTSKALKAATLAVALGVVSASAFAAVPLALDDAIDYTDTSADTAQLDLTYEDGRLVLHLAPDGSSAFPTVAVGDSPRFDAGEVPSDDHLAGELAGVELDVRAGTLHAAGFEHNGPVDQVIDAYVTKLDSLGFTATEESGAGNVQVYTFTNGEGSLRAVFKPTGAGAHAYLATL